MRGREIDPIDSALLDYLRAHLRAPSLAFAEPPAPISGGYDTRIFSLRLTGAPAAWSGPLILRVLGPHHDPRRALQERATQNPLATLGFPVPRVLEARADRAPLRAGFLLMERAAGRPLLEARRFGVSGALARTHAWLHTFDAGALLRALAEEGLDPSTLTFDGYLAALERRTRAGALAGLRDAMRWLGERRPALGPRLAICHGDFHPQNLLVADGRVSAVLDWPDALVAEAEYDVAATRAILTQTPVQLSSVPAAARPLIALLRPIMVARYLALYRRARALDPARLAYYEGASCMRGLVRAAEVRATPGAVPNPLDASSFADRLAARFARISGVAVALPPRRG